MQPLSSLETVSKFVVRSAAAIKRAFSSAARAAKSRSEFRDQSLGGFFAAGRWPRSNFAHHRRQAPPPIDRRGKHRPQSADASCRLLQATPLPVSTATGDSGTQRCCSVAVTPSLRSDTITLPCRSRALTGSTAGRGPAGRWLAGREMRLCALLVLLRESGGAHSQGQTREYGDGRSHESKPTRTSRPPIIALSGQSALVHGVITE